MNWMTKHYVQRPTPFDALEGLIDSGRPKNIILPPSRIFEDNIQGFKKYNQIETGSSQIRKVHLSYCLKLGSRLKLESSGYISGALAWSLF